MREAKRRMIAMLEPVGQGPMVAARMKISLQLRRSLSDAEIAMLSPEWLAIPARDEFSADGSVEMAL